MNGKRQNHEQTENYSDFINKKKKTRANFSPEEDIKLKQLVEIYGNKEWQILSTQMPGRNARQCKDRYTNYLAPNVVNGPWTDNEEELLKSKYKELGPSWKRISAFFPTRTDINVKSHWHLMERRIKRKELNEKKIILHKNAGSISLSTFKKFVNHQMLHNNIDPKTNFEKFINNEHIKENIYENKSKLHDNSDYLLQNNRDSTTPLPNSSPEKSNNDRIPQIMQIGSEKKKKFSSENDNFDFFIMDEESELIEHIYNFWS